MSQNEVDSVQVTITTPTSIKIGRGQVDYPAGTFRVKTEAYEQLKAKGVLENEGEQASEQSEVPNQTEPE